MPRSGERDAVGADARIIAGDTCIAADDVWIVPPGCGIWIPGGVPHSARATANARVDYLFVEPGASRLPDHCCALELTAMIRAMIDRLAHEPSDYSPDGHAARGPGDA